VFLLFSPASLVYSADDGNRIKTLQDSLKKQEKALLEMQKKSESRAMTVPILPADVFSQCNPGLRSLHLQYVPMDGKYQYKKEVCQFACD
jgi:hypothetical protein